MNFEAASQVVERAAGVVAPAVAVVVRQRGQVLWTHAAGWLDPETRTRPTRPDSLFDLASVTKLFVTTAFMTLVEENRVALDQPVCTVLPEFSGLRPVMPYEDPLKWGQHVQPQDPDGQMVDASRVTYRNLLAHNSGLPAWRRSKTSRMQPQRAAWRWKPLSFTPPARAPSTAISA